MTLIAAVGAAAVSVIKALHDNTAAQAAHTVATVAHTESIDANTAALGAVKVNVDELLDQLKPLHVKMQAYGIDHAIIMPNEGLESWPLEQTPTSTQALAELRKKIEAHQ